MAWLPDGEKISKIYSPVLTELTNVTEGQTDGQTPHDGYSRPYATHRAAKMQPQTLSSQLVPNTNSYHANSYPSQLVPTANYQYSYQRQLVPIANPTQVSENFI